MVRNIKCGYSFSKLGREEHVEAKFKRIRRNFLFCIKTASFTVSLLKMTLPGIKIDVISFYDVTCLTERQRNVRSSIQIVKEEQFL